MQKLSLRYFFFAIALLMATVTQAQRISTSIDKQSILIGEPIKFSVRFYVPNTNYRVHFDVPDSIQHFDILSKNLLDTVDKKDIFAQLTINVTSWDSGKWYIPAIPVAVTAPGGSKPYFLKTDPVEITVGYQKDEDADTVRDIKSIIEVSFTDDKFWYWIAAAVLGLLLLAFILYRLLRKKKPAEKPILESNLSPIDEARKSLNELRQAPVQNASDIKAYHTKLADIFKRYYSRKAKVNFLTYTTGDLLVAMKKDNVATGAVQKSAEGLRFTDAVKFAKFLPGATENAAALENIASAVEDIEKQSQSPANTEKKA